MIVSDIIELRLEYDRQWQLYYRKTGARGIVPLLGVSGFDERGRREAKEMAENWLDRKEPGWRNANTN